MSSMPQSAMRQKSRWGFGAGLLLVMLPFVSLAFVLSETWRAYAYTMGTTTSVTVQDPCVDGGTSRSGGDDDCRATWTVGGRVVAGTVHLAGEAADGPARPYQTTASVLGDEAYVRNLTAAHVGGLVAPWILLISVATLTVDLVVGNRQERRRKAAWRAWKAGQDAERDAG